MPRPREFDRAQALTRALHLFWQQGYERTTIKDLTEAMGISAPSLYNAFGDKKALFDEAVAEYEASPAIVMSRSADTPITADVVADILHTAVREYCSTAHPRGCFVISDPVLAGHRELGRDAIRGRIQRAREEGMLPAGADVDALTDYLDLVIRGLSALARDGVTAEKLSAAADIALSAWPRPRAAGEGRPPGA
jgi:AcrR family transcriptional regulator